MDDKQRKVTIYEVGPRDGLQNEKKLISTADKIELVNQLSACGFEKIEVTAFVSPKWVPQMADNSEVLAGITRNKKTDYAALTPNLKGYLAALKSNADEVAIFASASEGFSQANVNCSIAESLERFKPIIERAADDDMPIRGYVSCVTHCPFDGATPPEMVARSVAYLKEAGCYEVSLGETLGWGQPEDVEKMLDAVLQEISPLQLAGHFHDTKGFALKNIEFSLEKGVRTFDSSIAGLGGCPYAPGAAGNVDTSKVISRLENLGYHSGIDQTKLSSIAHFAKSLV